MAGAARLPHQAAFHSELLPASQSDRAAMGPDAQKRYAQQMLCNLRAVRRRDARFPARTSSSQLGALLRFGHRQLPRHLAQKFSGHDMNGVYQAARVWPRLTTEHSRVASWTSPMKMPLSCTPGHV